MLTLNADFLDDDEMQLSVFLHGQGYDIRTVKTTMIYTHVLNRGGKG
ncbi:MAG: hypothetical protein GY715_08675 [Planctomycetes bacterium]|nr:hypothetical protein [Planctomycetota bacterium]